MPIVYSPDGVPYEVPHGEIPSFIRRGFRTTNPTPTEIENAEPAKLVDTTKTGGVSSSGQVEITDTQHASDLVPSLKQIDGSWDNAGSTEQINVNQATLKELVALPGVGTAIAKKVIDNRPYESAEDLIAKVDFPSGDWLALSSKLTF